MYFGIFLLFFIVSAALEGCASPNTVHDDPPRREKSGKVSFAERDRHIIRDYYKFHPLPRSSPSRFDMPPALQKQMVRNGALPPVSSIEQLPAELEMKLKPLPEGYVRVRLGPDIMIVDSRNNLIIDILKDVDH